LYRHQYDHEAQTHEGGCADLSRKRHSSVI
jgi:hypothetical protein